MKTELILEIVSGICLLLGCVFYILHSRKEDDKKYAILCIILTAIGIGLFVGTTNKPSQTEYTPQYYESGGENNDIEEETYDYEQQNELDP
jgi:hypothetical protein